jgi:hypothetical protein
MRNQYNGIPQPHVPLKEFFVVFQEMRNRKNQRHKKDSGNLGRIRTGTTESY